MKNKKKKTSILTKQIGERHIGTISFDCHETGQNCTMLVFQDGNKLRMDPVFKTIDGTPLSITIELWNRFSGHMKEDLS